MDISRPDSGTFTKPGLIALFAIALAACSSGNESTEIQAEEGTSSEPPSLDYALLDEELQPFRDDFNANVGKVRMVFISGPTCAICLRGMADFQRDLMSQISGDPRYEVFVVHVPALGATEENVVQSLPLLHGPNVHHYWDEIGTTGIRYQELLDVRFYVWDWWSMYGPDARWDGELPPSPDYWEHQLGPFPRELYLDTKRFTAKVLEAGSDITLAEELVASRNADLEKGVRLDAIFQGLGVAIPTHHKGRGDYENLIKIQRIESEGSIETADGRHFSIFVNRDRAQGYQRIVGGQAARNRDGEIHLPAGERGLPSWVERILLDSYEFDGMITDWKDKGHEAEMIGMETFNAELNWVIEIRQKQGFHWELLANTHAGDLVKSRLLDESGGVRLEIREVAHEQVNSFRFPTEIRYFDGDGQLLATERLKVARMQVEGQEEYIAPRIPPRVGAR
ncbi:MAG: hypothetical protein V3T39_08340 [Gammaproteobacteria bacterium]